MSMGVCEYNEMVAQWKRKQRRESRRTGRLAALLININRKKGDPPTDSNAFTEHDDEDGKQ